MKTDTVNTKIRRTRMQTVVSMIPERVAIATSLFDSSLNLSRLNAHQPPEILFISSFPPRECGIATYSQDLISSLNNKFGTSFTIKVCALESGKTDYNYSSEVDYVLDTTDPMAFNEIARKINSNNQIKIVLIQHEFGFFSAQEKEFIL